MIEIIIFGIFGAIIGGFIGAKGGKNTKSTTKLPSNKIASDQDNSRNAKGKKSLTNLNEVDIIVRLEKKSNTIYAYDLNGDRVYNISSASRKRAYKNKNYLGRKIYKSGTIRWMDLSSEEVEKESNNDSFIKSHLPKGNSEEKPIKDKSTKYRKKHLSSRINNPKKKKNKTTSKGTANAFIRELANERASQSKELRAKLREADRYRTSQMRGTLLSLSEGIRKNIILNYSVELIRRLNSEKKLSSNELTSMKSYFKREKNILKKHMAENKKESANYAPCLVKSQLDNVIEAQDNNSTLIKMNEVILSRLMNKSLPKYMSTLRKNISVDKKESLKYEPCMHKTIIDLRILVSQCTVAMIENWNNDVDAKKIASLKKSISADKKEIEKYKPSHYQFLLEFRKSIHTGHLLDCYGANVSDSASLLKGLKSTKNKYSRQSKKYAPCTHKYLLQMVSEYNDYLIKINI